MGLNAIVYKNKESAKALFGNDIVDVDPITKEPLLNEHANVGNANKSLIATERSLGNLAQIAYLRTEISNYLESTSIILTDILASASRSGYSIQVSNFDKILQEIARIRSVSSDRSVGVFADAMEGLIQSAKGENNPIVLV